MIRDTRKILEVISEETRYEIVKLLSSSARFLTVNDISEKLNKDKKTIDKHLRILLEHGLVERKYLEDERSYGYTLTKLCSNIMVAIEKAITMHESLEIESPKIQNREIQIKKKTNFRNVFLSLFFLFLSIIVGYGKYIGLINNSDKSIVIMQTLGFIIFIVLAIFFFYLTIRERFK